MTFIYNLFKKTLFSLFFGVDFEDIDALDNLDADVSFDENSQDNLETNNSNIKNKKILTYLKFALISSLSFISLIILIQFLNYDPNLDELQNLLNELATTVDWSLYRDIFLNIQKILSSSVDKSMALYVLQEIHFFFLTNTTQVQDSEKFDKIMKEIIAFLKDDY